MSEDIAEEIRSFYRGSSASRGEAFDIWFAEVTANEQERIINKLLSSLIEFQYWNGLTSHRINPNDHTKDEAEAILRNIIKED